MNYVNFLFKNVRFLNGRVFFELIQKVIVNKKNRLLLLERMQWFIIGPKYDVVHAHFGHIGGNVVCLKTFKNLAKTKFIVSFHGYDLSPDLVKFNKMRYDELFRLADTFIVNTKYLKRILIEVKGNNDKIVVIPVGLDTNYFKPSGNIRFQNSILFCGRLIPLKAPNLAIEIIDYVILKQKNLKLTIIGSGPMENGLKCLVAEKGLQKSIKFLGDCSQESVKKIMDQHQILLMPGIYDFDSGRAETQGLVIQEAQAMEMPVLVSNAGGMKYGLIDGKTGFVLPQGKVDVFGDKILELIKTPESMSLMGRRGRKFVKKNYDVKYIVNKHLELFK